MTRSYAITITFTDGTSTPRVEEEYPIGHRRRRAEGLPHLYKKFEENLKTHYSDAKAAELMDLFLDHDRLLATPVHVLMDMM